jgi:hypothetical protein
MKLRLLILLASAPLLAGTDPARILKAISLVESGANLLAVGDSGKALGAWQIHPAAWEDANTYRRSQGLPALPRARWREVEVQEGVAKAFLSVIQTRLARAGVSSPTPAQIALCWNVGFTGARSRGFRPNSYANRVARIY